MSFHFPGSESNGKEEGSEWLVSVVDQDPDPRHVGNLDPDSHPHQIIIRIRTKIYKLDPDLHQFADVKPKCTGMEYEPILALFQGFEPFFEARIWIRIRIRVTSRIRIRIKVMLIHNTGARKIERKMDIIECEVQVH